MKTTKRSTLLMLALVSTLLALTGCKPAESPTGAEVTAPAPPPPMPSTEEALALARSASPSQGVEMNASFKQEIEELASLGLLKDMRPNEGGQYHFELSEQGVAAGLSIIRSEDRERDRIFGPVAVEGALCKVVPDGVKEIAPLAQGPKPAATVHYQLRYESTPLYAQLQPLAATPQQQDGISLARTLEWCDPAKRFDGQFIAVQRDSGWQLNHKPGAPEPGISVMTEREYDNAGLLTGAVSTLTIPGPIADADGDPLEVKGWTNFRIFNDETEKIEPTDRVEIDGLNLRFRHGVRMGEPEWFSADYTVSDPWEETVFEFCIEDAYVRC